MASPLSKLERPPFVQNFVRYVHPTVVGTANALVQFALNTPQTTYAAGSRILQDRLLFGLDRETVLKAAATKGHEKSRPHVVEYLTAFLNHDEQSGLHRLPSFDQVVEPFRVSREISVPVKPLVVCSEAGRLNAIFAVGWASVPLTDDQWRLEMTMIDDAVFTLTDFERADGTIFSFPRAKQSDPKSRKPLIVRRGDFSLLSKNEMKDRLQVYLSGLSLAKSMLRDIRADEETKAGKPAENSDQMDLFPTRA